MPRPTSTVMRKQSRQSRVFVQLENAGRPFEDAPKASVERHPAQSGAAAADTPTRNCRCPKNHRHLSSRDHDWSHFLIQNTPGAVITADQEGRIIEWNRAAERLTGFSRDEAMGRPAEEVVRLRGDDVSTWKQVLQGRKEITEEVLLSNRSGQEVPVMVSSFALRDDRGTPPGRGHHHSGPDPGEAYGDRTPPPGQHVRP